MKVIQFTVLNRNASVDNCKEYIVNTIDDNVINTVNVDAVIMSGVWNQNRMMVLSLNRNIVLTVWTGILELTVDYNSDLFFIKYCDYRLVVYVLELFISTSTTILLLMCNALFWFMLQQNISQLGINKVHHIWFIFSHLIETKRQRGLTDSLVLMISFVPDPKVTLLFP